MVRNDTIVASATPAGGALAVIRLSGPEALTVAGRIFRGRGEPLAQSRGYQARYGRIVDGERLVDEVVALVFRAPNSYTGDDSVEFSCHGSSYIVGEILRLCCAAGARMAEAGEFTTRAFLAGKLDLAQAEAVADMIASRSRAAHAVASMQLRGGVSEALNALRDKLLSLTSLLELELDFSEEDVTFADRTELRETMVGLEHRMAELMDSFRLGNALKEGVTVAIVGAPNVGKSTLLNRLAGEERAMVSEIAGTTRDTVEEEINIDGIVFRFIDTAGLRDTSDRLEQMGIDRTRRAIARARIVLKLDDATRMPSAGAAATAISIAPEAAAAPSTTVKPAMEPVAAPHDLSTPEHAESISLREDQILIKVLNKCDLQSPQNVPEETILLSAKRGDGIGDLRRRLRRSVDTAALDRGDTIVSTHRHAEALRQADRALQSALGALDDGLPADLLSEEIRQVIHHIGTITGAITTDEVLKSIFSKFCIGK